MFTSEERGEQEINRQTSALAAVMQTLYWCITVKREQSGSGQLLIYLHEMLDSLGNCVLSDVVVHLDISCFFALSRYVVVSCYVST